MGSTLLILGSIFICATIGCVIILILAKNGWFSYRNTFQSDADTKLSQMFLFFDPRKLFAMNVVAMLMIPALVYLFSQSPLYAVMTFVILLVLPRFLYRWLYARRVVEFETGLPDALAQIAGSIRAGSTLPSGIEILVAETKGPISQEFSLMLKEYRLGVNVDEAMSAMNERIPCESLNLMVAAANVAKDVGGNLAEIFERLSETLRQKQAMEGKIIALTSQGKLQGWVVGFLPIGMLFMLNMMDPNIMTALSTSILGWGFIAVMLILELLGLFMIRKIVNIDV